MKTGGEWGEPITDNDFILKIRRLILDIPVYDSSLWREQSKNAVRLKVLNRGACYLCNCNRVQKDLLAHHVIPNGPGTEDNLEPLCFVCHTWVHHMLRKLRNYRGSSYARHYECVERT